MVKHRAARTQSAEWAESLQGPNAGRETTGKRYILDLQTLTASGSLKPLHFPHAGISTRSLRDEMQVPGYYITTYLVIN